MAVGSSFRSKRLDIAPLCQDEPVLMLPPGLCTDSDVGTTAPPTPAMYIAALPFPGRAEGSRLIITEVPRGII